MVKTTIHSEGGDQSRFGIIWDMDGVLIDSVPFHYQAWQEVFTKRGKNLDKAISEKPFGHVDTIKAIMGADISENELKAIAAEKEAVFRRLIARKIQPLPGVISLIHELNTLGFKQAVASASPMENIRLILTGIGGEDLFDAVVCAEDVTHVKPDPGAFITAAQRLGVKIKSCLVIEDMPAGIQAARSIGMRCIGVATNRPREMLESADAVVKSPNEISVQLIISLINLLLNLP